ncbi:putative tyrosine--tRNA ligase, mitochondrial, partial [Stegodyphus mimosarum]
MSTKVFYHSDVASLAKLNIDEVKQIFPLSAVSEIPFEAGISILDLAMKAGCFINEGDAKRIITGGGMYLNFERITSPEAVLVPSHHILPNNISLIRIGKKNYYIVIWR